MLTMTILSITALLKAVFVVIALAVVGRTQPTPDAVRRSWVWLTAAFMVSALSGLFQAVWAAFAFAAGPGAGVYELYLLWMPAMNYSRFGVMIALGISLSVLAFLPPRPAHARIFWPTLLFAAMLLPGIAAGYAEGAYSGLHPSRLSVLQVVETVALLSALFAAVVRRTMDTLLWLTLFVYAVRQAVNSLYWAGVAWESVQDAWHPPFWLDPAVGLLVWLIMIGLVGFRLRLARAGSSTPPIFAIPGDEASRLADSTGIDGARR